MAWNENNDLIHGDSLLLYLTDGQSVLAYATSVSLETSSETIDTSSKFSCKWSSAMGGKASYTINADALYCNSTQGISFDGLLEMMVKGEQVEWYIGQESAWTGTCESNPHTLDTAQTYYNGKGVISSASLTAGNNEIATCSCTITGAGEIQKNGAQIGGSTEEGGDGGA